jgi:hypothetical protein
MALAELKDEVVFVLNQNFMIVSKTKKAAVVVENENWTRVATIK